MRSSRAAAGALLLCTWAAQASGPMPLSSRPMPSSSRRAAQTTNATNATNGTLATAVVVEAVCPPFSSSAVFAPSLRGFFVPNASATTVRDLGAVRCTAGYAGSPTVRCAGGAWLLPLGCEENLCRAFPNASALAARGFAVFGNSTASTVSGLGRIRCADDWMAESRKPPTVLCPETGGSFALRGCVPEQCARAVCPLPRDECVAPTICTAATAPGCTVASARPNGTACYVGPLYGGCSTGLCVARVPIVSRATLRLNIRSAAFSADQLFAAVAAALATVLSSSELHCEAGDITIAEWRISYGDLVVDYYARVLEVQATEAAVAAAAGILNDPRSVGLPEDAMNVTWSDTNLLMPVSTRGFDTGVFRMLAWHRSISTCPSGCGRASRRIFDGYFCTENGEPTDAAVCTVIQSLKPTATSRVCEATKPCCDDVGPLVRIQGPAVLTTRTGSSLRLHASSSLAHCEKAATALVHYNWSARSNQPIQLGPSGSSRWLDIDPFTLPPGEATVEAVAWLSTSPSLRLRRDRSAI